MLRHATAALALTLCHTLPPGAVETPPAPGTPRDFVLPSKETFRLDNGLTVTFLDYGTVPQVTVLAVVRTGNIDEGERTWLADVAVEMLKEGTSTRTASELALAAARMGGDLGVGAGAEQTTVGISVLSEHAADAAALVADVLRNPLLPESELPRIKANFERSLSVALSSPSSLASQQLARMVYGAHPFGRTLPEPGQLAGHSIDDVRRFYADNFGARRTHVYVAGRYDRTVLEAALRAAFGDWVAGPAPSDHRPEVRRRLQLALVGRPDAPQSSLRMAVVAPGPAATDYFPFTVMNTLLGGSFASRITTNLREDKGYTYSPQSSLIARRQTALWTLSADVTTEHTADSLTEIYREIATLQDAAPPEQELQAIKNYRAGLFVVSNSSPDGLLGQLAFMDLHGLPEDYLTTWVANVFAVTPEQVSEMARRWIDPASMAVVVVGDLEKVAGPVKALPQLRDAQLQSP